MNRFAHLLDRLATEPRRNAKVALVAAYLREAPDPDRGYGLAAMTDALVFRHAKPNVIRALIEARTDPVLFRMSHDYVGDLSETVALLWPAPEGVGPGHNKPPPPSLSEVVEALGALPKAALPEQLAAWLDLLDETGRWALLKLITGSLRIGVSARLAKTALASLGAEFGRQPVTPDEVEHAWHGQAPPFAALFAWVEGRGPVPEADDPAPFRPVMLSHPAEDADRAKLDPADFAAEWKWDGIRVQAVRGTARDGAPRARLFSRTGEDASGAFPDLADVLAEDAAVDGELLVVREGRVQPFAALQQRLNRKVPTPKVMAEQPAHLRAYDLLVEGGEDLRHLPLTERRARLEALVARQPSAGGEAPRLSLSPLIAVAPTWEALAAARADPAAFGAGEDAGAVEGLMLKRRDSPYLAGRPKGPWWKWKRAARTVDAVMMYAQRGHGKRSSYYSDYTFGLWREGPSGAELVPVGKAYSGFTDEELKRLDRHVRNTTTNRFGPVREVKHGAHDGLVLEIAFEGLQRSTRHKSGVAMRFPRVARIRWDKPPAEADRLEALEALLPAAEG